MTDLPPEPISSPAIATNATPAGKLRRAVNVALAFVFLTATVAPMTGLWRDGISQMIEKTENRRIADFPQLEGKWRGPFWIPRKGTMLEFPSTFEVWFNDRLGGRRQFIGVRNLATYAGLTSESVIRPQQGQARNAQVIIGRDGWLFATVENLVDDFRCTCPFTEKQLDRWQQVLTARHDWLARRGIKYVVMIAPNSQTIYGEYMPRTITRVNPHSRTDQLIARLKASTNIPVLDPRARLIAGKTNWPTYHKTDTHWNDYGAFLAYEQLCEALQPLFPVLRPARIADFVVTVKEAEGMELARAVESIVRFPEQLVTLEPKQSRQAVHTAHVPSGAGQTRVSTNPQAELNRAVVLHDSFFWALWPYVSEHWQQVRYAWGPGFPIDIIEQDKPEIVIQEFVERRFMIYDPENPAAVDAEQQQHLAAKPGNVTR